MFGLEALTTTCCIILMPLGRGAFVAAVEQYPESNITQRHEARVIPEH